MPGPADQADLRANPAESEEQRQEQQHRHRLELRSQRLGHARMFGEHGAEQKRAKQRVDADDLGDRARHQEQEQRAGDSRGRERILPGHAVPQTP